MPKLQLYRKSSVIANVRRKFAIYFHFAFRMQSDYLCPRSVLVAAIP